MSYIAISNINFFALQLFKNKFYSLVVLLIAYHSLAQQQTKMAVVLDAEKHVFNIKQTITFTNNSNKSLSKIVLNDWNHAYSDKFSPLGKRFSDEFVRNFHFAANSERGNTGIHKITINELDAPWNRAKEHLDIIEVSLPNELKSQESVTLDIDYAIKIPDSKFTRFGYENGNYYLKNCFLSVSRLSKDGAFNYNSNENLEDITNAYYQKVAIDYTIPLNYYLTSDFDIINQTETNTTKTISIYAENRNEIQLALEQKVTFESFKNDKVEVETNLYTSRLNGIQKAIVIDKVVNFIADNLLQPTTKKVMVSDIDYQRNPFYGLNQLPSFISPFKDDFMYEIKFLKTYLYSYLKSTLKIDQRKDSYIFDAIQMYIMMKYIQENYPNNKLLGSISSFKIFKGYHLTDVGFNEQYTYFHLLMARQNTDQIIGDSKNTFIKFNEQIAGKYKAGLSFNFLKAYLQDNSIDASFKEFLTENISEQKNSSDFENILRKNATKNIDWFFPNLIYSRKLIDYKFSSVKKDKDQVEITIKNISKTAVPISFYGLYKKEMVFKEWLPAIKTDTTFSISRKNINRLGLNFENEIPEFNSRNNWKSLRSIFSMNRPLKLNFYKDLENPRYTQIFYVPEISFNLYDGILSTISFNNKSFLDKPFIFDVSPSYSAKTRNLYGSGGLTFNKYYRNTNLYHVRYGLSGSYSQYAQDASYLRINPSIAILFRESDLRSNVKKYFLIRNIFVNKEDSPLNAITNPDIEKSPLNYSVFDARYVYSNNEMSKGFSAVYDIQFASNFGKIAADIAYRKLFENNFEIGLRLYAGTFLYRNTTSDFFNFGLDRPKDYLFDYNFYGRSESKGFFSQQIIIAEGGFKSKFANPFANQWMTTFNANASIWQWVQVYGDIGTYKNKEEKAKFVFDSGVHLNLVPGYFQVFFPVYSTNGFELGQKNYQEKLRFVVTFSPRTLISLFTRKWF
jgi:hypothetical protein